MSPDIALTEGERRILDLLIEHDFTGDGCCPSQERLAALSFYTRQHVNRCIKGLERKGMVEIAKARRPGCKWSHNVYRTRHWNPHKRSDLLNRWRQIERARNARCDTERTAGPSRAHTSALIPLRKRVVGVPTSVVAGASNCARCGSEIRGSHMEQRECTRCRELETHLRQAQDKLAEREHELQGRELQLLRAGRVEVALRNQLKAGADENGELNAETQLVRAVLSHWREVCKGGSKRVGISLDGDRAKVVRRALRSLTTGDLEARGQRCLDAVSGLALRPYVGPRGRVATDSNGATRRDDVRYALMDEQHIEEHAAYWARAQGSDVRRKFEAWQGIALVAERHFELWRLAAREETLRRLEAEQDRSSTLFGVEGVAA